MNIINIYGQEIYHADAKIIGNKVGLIALRELIDKALKDGEAQNSGCAEDDAIFASDGEGYQLKVECHDDKWGIEGGESSYWNKPESRPYYYDQFLEGV